MTDERARIFYDEGDFQVVIGVDHVTIVAAVHGILGMTPVSGGVLIHRRLLAQLVRFLDEDSTRLALALPRVVRVTRAGNPLPGVENSDASG